MCLLLWLFSCTHFKADQHLLWEFDESLNTVHCLEHLRIHSCFAINGLTEQTHTYIHIHIHPSTHTYTQLAYKSSFNRVSEKGSSCILYISVKCTEKRWGSYTHLFTLSFMCPTSTNTDAIDCQIGVHVEIMYKQRPLSVLIEDRELLPESTSSSTCLSSMAWLVSGTTAEFSNKLSSWHNHT